MSNKKLKKVVKNWAGYKQGEIEAKKIDGDTCAEFLAKLGEQMIESNKVHGCKG